MRAMSEGIEGARDFQGFMDKSMAGERGQVTQDTAGDERRYSVVLGRQPGENRAAHRARLKRERREAKAHKVAA